MMTLNATKNGGATVCGGCQRQLTVAVVRGGCANPDGRRLVAAPANVEPEPE
jgi:hypothetical protein